MNDLTTLSTPTRIADDQFRWEVPEGWQQGRGAFGGLVIATLVRAVETVAETPERVVRTVAAHLVGPVLVGSADISVERLRIGNGVSSLAASLRQGDEVLAHAVLVLGKTRSTEFDRQDVSAPEIPDWQSFEPLPVRPPLGPTFAEHFEFRSTGPLPFSGGSRATSGGFVRPLLPGRARDAAYVAAQADGWWPAVLATLTAPRPTATVSYNLQLLTNPAELDPSLPLFHRARALAALDGYVAEHRELWTLDGRLVALNQQTFAVIR